MFRTKTKYWPIQSPESTLQETQRQYSIRIKKQPLSGASPLELSILIPKLGLA